MSQIIYTNYNANELKRNNNKNDKATTLHLSRCRCICAKCKLWNPHNLQKAYGFPNDMNGFLLREDKRISLLLCVYHEPSRFIVCIFPLTLIQFYQLWLSNELNLEMQQSNKQTNNKHNETTFSFNCKTIAYEILAAKWRCTHNSSKYDFHPSNNRINNNINNIHCEQSNRFNGSTELYRISLSLS